MLSRARGFFGLRNLFPSFGDLGVVSSAGALFIEIRATRNHTAHCPQRVVHVLVVAARPARAVPRPPAAAPTAAASSLRASLKDEQVVIPEEERPPGRLSRLRRLRRRHGRRPQGRKAPRRGK